MIKTVRHLDELQCKNCGKIQVRGETFNGQRCCEHSHPSIFTGKKREIVTYEKTIEEEKAEVMRDIAHPSGNEWFYKSF